MLAATPVLRLLARWHDWRSRMRKPAAVQQAQLITLVQRAASTRFGRDHNFESIQSVADYQARVPLRTYEDFWSEYWKPEFPRPKDCTWPGTPPYFALTSGTTSGVTKYIPVTQEMLRANERAAWRTLLYHLLNCPDSRILGGKCLLLGGSTQLHQEATGIWSGDLSGIQANEIPWWAASYIFPPRGLALLADWEEKIDRMARLCVSEEIRAMSGAPNWLLLFLDRVGQGEPSSRRRLSDLFPNLELIVHGGVSFHPYARQYSDLLEGSRAEVREVYPASEAFIAVADRGEGDGMRLLIDNGVFYEFVPRDELDRPSPARYWLENVDVDVDYALALSTCAGAWGYVLGDTVRFVDLDPPRILITGRTSYFLSAFGEHLIDEEIEKAVAIAAASVRASVIDYAVAPIVPDLAGSAGRHHYIIEFAGELPDDPRLSQFGKTLDEQLCRLNADYKSCRAWGVGLAAPHIEAAEPGTFSAWMKSKGKLGGQHKVPRIVNDAALFAELVSFVSDAKAASR